MSGRIVSVFPIKVALLPVALAACAIAYAAPPAYKLTRLGRLGYEASDGHAINNSGQVMGSLYTAGPHVQTHTFFYDGATMFEIAPKPSGVFGNDINNRGEITGSVVSEAFIYRNNQFIRISTPEFQFSTAFDINDLGQVIGYVNGPGIVQDSTYIYDRGKVTILPTGPFIHLFPTAINNRGQATGLGAKFPGENGFLYSNGTTIDIGTVAGGRTSRPFAMNESGEITGVYTAVNERSKAFRYSSGVIRDLGTLGGNESIGFGINSSGDVVGDAQLVDGHFHAFVHKDGKMVDLGALDKTDSDASTITNNGIVAGVAMDGTLGSDVFGNAVFIYGVDGKITHDLDDLISPSDPLQPFVHLYDVGFTRSVNALGQVLANGIDSRTSQTHTYIASPIDSTKPVIVSKRVGTKGTNGWFTSDVSLSWTVMDAEAPVADTSGCGSSNVTHNTAGKEFTCRAISIGGTTSKTVTIKRDTSVPTVTITKPAGGATYDRDAVVVANYNCADSPSGIATCKGTVPDGAPIDTSKAVTNGTFQVIATDKAGISRIATKTYSVR